MKERASEFFEENGDPCRDHGNALFVETHSGRQRWTN